MILDSTVATPFLSKPLQRDDRRERPDYLIHSYTKDLTGNGALPEDAPPKGSAEGPAGR